MDEKAIKREIADILEVEEDELNPENRLEEYEAWDSIAVLAIISLVSENKGAFLHADDINKLNTVGDLFNLLG